jgi:hypothetical protein
VHSLDGLGWDPFFDQQVTNNERTRWTPARVGCAVSAAVERGELAAERLASYRRLQREDDFLRARNDEGARLERTRKAKQIAKAVRLQYKLRRR